MLTPDYNDGFVTRVQIKADPLGLPKNEQEKDAYVEISLDEVTIHNDALDDF